MTAQQLKNSILQMAVQGKLVPQDPDDESASVLLERIKAEKQELIKAGKIKNDKKSSEIFRGASRNLPYTFCEQIGREIRDISDEIPFDIPESWEWVRLGEIGDTNIGLTYRPSDKTTSDGTLVLRSSNIQNDKMDYTDNVYVSCNVPERAMIHKGDILICARNGSRALVGKCAIVDKDGMAFGAFMAKFSSPFNQYIKLFIDSPIFRQQLDGVKTETINQITQDMLKNQLFPLPPIKEQARIVKMFHTVLPYIEKYKQAETQLTVLNTNFPEMLKKSILQEAVQGKLVPQNPDDEPASVLLERIRAEKQALIKAGKIKKDKHESTIVTRDKIPYEIIEDKERCIADDVPFEIPESWCWCRLKSITNKITDGTHHSPPNLENGEYKYITAKNIKEDGINLDNITFVSKEIHDEIFSRCNPEINDILLIKDGATTGIVTVNNIVEPFSLLSSVALIKQSHFINPWYLVYVLRSDLFYRILRSQMKGTGITRITLKQIEPLLIPLPPLNEQNRIVLKIEELMQYCEML